MSRSKKFARSLMSGYALLGMTVLYTLISARIAVHYLTDEDFGLWAVITGVCSQLLLIGMGLAGSVARVLVDHKDDRESSAYGSVIQTSFLVLLVQGGAIALVGAGLSQWLPTLMQLEPHLWDTSRRLMIWQSLMLAISFVGRIFGDVLQANQRFDMQNYAQMGQLAVGLVALWLGFERGMGLFSQVLANAAGFTFSIVFMFIATISLKLYPARGKWGRPSQAAFKHLFDFGKDVFLMTVGAQLLTASQAIILGRTLGLEAAAVWTNLTKTFVMGQQFVGRIFDYASSALAEMVVRGENELLHRRFREIVMLTASVCVLAGAGIAVCNDSFVHLWLKGRFAWNPWNNWLMAGLLVVNGVSRCHVGLLGQWKDIKTMRYIYFLEAACFVVAAFLITPALGIEGMIGAAILANLLWSGAFSVRRTAKRFGSSVREMTGFDGWMKQPLRFLLALWPVALGCWLLARSLPPSSALVINGSLILLYGGWLFWRIGLAPEGRGQALSIFARLNPRLNRSPAANR